MPSGAGLQKNLPHNQLWPRVGNFVADIHRISISYAMARLDLALDTPNDSDTPYLGCGVEVI